MRINSQTPAPKLFEKLGHGRRAVVETLFQPQLDVLTVQHAGPARPPSEPRVDVCASLCQHSHHVRVAPLAGFHNCRRVEVPPRLVYVIAQPRIRRQQRPHLHRISAAQHA